MSGACGGGGGEVVVVAEEMWERGVGRDRLKVLGTTGTNLQTHGTCELLR